MRASWRWSSLWAPGSSTWLADRLPLWVWLFSYREGRGRGRGGLGCCTNSNPPTGAAACQPSPPPPPAARSSNQLRRQTGQGKECLLSAQRPPHNNPPGEQRGALSLSAVSGGVGATVRKTKYLSGGEGDLIFPTHPLPSPRWGSCLAKENRLKWCPYRNSPSCHLK